MVRTLLQRFTQLDFNERGYLDQIQLNQILQDINIEIDECLQVIVFDTLKIQNEHITFIGLSQLVYTAQNADLKDPLNILFTILDYKQKGYLQPQAVFKYLACIYSNDNLKEIIQQLSNIVIKDRDEITFEIFQQIFQTLK
ncbi:hypothetical protein SS50377_20073 [Spironucleus salmonicida]|uniref:EF-hand domain-containing protein n=1 Tax=Spironucleus salmonicida TaxID=348837 RepID=V6LXJ8_9EUKA|nr:hypothetical protein SS50377_20073 [Spironucleus salmonicida]|eukprot:EST49357.1 hypothetical protein SS50377_10282 [Spironucleus salmonicida]